MKDTIDFFELFGGEKLDVVLCKESDKLIEGNMSMWVLLCHSCDDDSELLFLFGSDLLHIIIKDRQSLLTAIPLSIQQKFAICHFE